MSENIDFSYSFDPSDRIKIDGEVRSYAGGFEAGHLFKKPGVDHQDFFTHKQLLDMVESERLTVDRRHFTLPKQRLVAAGNVLAIQDVPEAERAWLHYKYDITLRWRAKRQTTPLGHTTAGAKEALGLAYSDYLADAQKAAKSGKALTVFPRVGYSTICGWNALLAANDDLIVVLRDKRHWRSGNFGPKLHHEVENLIQETVAYYLNHGAKSAQFCWDHFLVPKTFELRLKMKRSGELCDFGDPSLTTLKARIAAVDQFTKIACRYSLDAAIKILRSKGKGINIIRPGGRGEIDGWVFHLHTLLGDTEVWGNLTPAQIKKLSAVRVTVIVIIDTATRSITGVQFSWSESKDSAVSAVRMSLRDKSDIAAAYGCNSTWPQRSDDLLVGDVSGAFKNDDATRVILNALGAQQFTLPARPWLKGRVEAFFKKCAHDFVQFFTGVAWSDPKKRNLFNAQADASIEFSELRRLFIRWIVDDYHHTYHPELGMTPFAAWHLLGRRMPPTPPRSKGEISAIFGRIEQLPLTSAGVRVAGNDYHSRELQKLIDIVGLGHVVECRIDDLDLGQVSVALPKGIEPARVGLGSSDEPTRWIHAVGPEEVAGISLWQMDQADQRLLIEFGADAATSEQIRNKARLEFLEVAAEAARRVAFNHAPSEELLKRAREGFHAGLNFSMPQPGPDKATVAQMHESVPTGTARTLAEDAAQEVEDDGESEEIQIRFASDEATK